MAGRLKVYNASTSAWEYTSGGLPPFLGAIGTASGTSCADAAYTVLAFNAESVDTVGMHDNTTNNTRFTVPAGYGGAWLIRGKINYPAGTGGNRRGVAVFLDGAEVDSSKMMLQWATAAVPNFAGHISTSAVIVAAAGQYFGVAAWQNTGGAVTCSGYIECVFLGTA